MPSNFVFRLCDLKRHRSAPSMFGAEQTVKEIDAMILENARLQKDLQAQVKKGKAKLLRERAFVLDVALVLLTWTGSRLSVSRFLMCEGFFTGSQGEEEVLNEIEDRFVHMPLPTLEAIQRGETPPLARKVYEKATRTKQQLHLLTWVEQQNDEHGVAPTTAMLWEHMFSDQGEATSFASMTSGGRSKAAITKWTQRFRRRWGLKLIASAPHENVPIPDLRDKVARAKR